MSEKPMFGMGKEGGGERRVGREGGKNPGERNVVERVREGRKRGSKADGAGRRADTLAHTHTHTPGFSGFSLSLLVISSLSCLHCCHLSYR